MFVGCDVGSVGCVLSVCVCVCVSVCVNGREKELTSGVWDNQDEEKGREKGIGREREKKVWDTGSSHKLSQPEREREIERKIERR